MVLNVFPNSKAMMYEENRNYIHIFSNSHIIVSWKVIKNISDEAISEFYNYTSKLRYSNRLLKRKVGYNESVLFMPVAATPFK